ncbi:hypothetical protein [Agrococcus sp. SGAir0287]|uniref:hypothetical protein n=1 Tax=Agrococcus sp. SGAir0287 TaxID=2070347 RepID=UPI0010CD1F63|nr:hypothetical protein [Agrococcus sp. SGAir0287]QCR18673.1 hypothetical protein C1N71_03750 [Agrococcus sp. SGAir0287]
MRRSSTRSALVAIAALASVVGMLQPGTATSAQALPSVAKPVAAQAQALPAAEPVAAQAQALPAAEPAAVASVDAAAAQVDAPASAEQQAPAAAIAPLPAAADWRNFNAGNIISDANFYAGGTMSAQQVQSFIESRNSSCTSGYTCLYQYWQATPTMAGNAYCQPIGGSGGMSAAQIIAAVGAACNISQRALLVLLEKEQGLVTSRAPAPWRYSSATGFACPDTAPCDSSFGGFFYQVYYAARQFNVYKTFPTSFNHQPAAWNTVLYHPNSACGSSRIYVANFATAGLYNYTPYQPNSAALANLYGTGDACSAYGNRNFWRQWTDWFGDPTSGASLMQSSQGGDVFLISGQTRHRFRSYDLYLQYQSLGPVRIVSLQEIESYADGPDISRAVQAADGTAYYVDDGRLLRFRSCTQAQDYGAACGGLPQLTSSQLATMRAGQEWLNQVARTPDGVQWLVQGQQRREIVDLSLLPQYGIPALASNLTASSVSGMRLGPPVLGPGVYATAAGQWVRLITGTGAWAVSSASDGLPFTLAARDVTAASLALVATGNGTLPLRVRNGSTTAILAADGWLRVDAAQMGGTSMFTAVDAATLEGLPQTSTPTPPFFLRERGTSTTTYLVSSGILQPMATQADIDWVVRTYGVSSRVHVGAVGVLRDMPMAAQVATSQVVRTASDPVWYLVDEGRRYAIADSRILTSLGLSTSSTLVSPDVLAARGPVAGTLSSNLISCAGTTYFASNGFRHGISAAVAAEWGRTPLPLAAATCARSTLVAGAFGTTTLDAAGNAFRIDGGGRYLLQGAAAQAARDGLAVSRADAAMLAQLPVRGTITQAAAAGSFVRLPSGTVGYYDGTTILPFSTPGLAVGFGGGAPTAIDATFASLSTTGTTISTPAVRCGTTVGFAVGGRLMPYASSAVASAWNVSHTTIPSALCSVLPAGSPVTQYVTVSGRTWLVEGGTSRELLTQRAIDRLGAPLVGITPVTGEVVGLLRAGQPIPR